MRLLFSILLLVLLTGCSAEPYTPAETTVPATVHVTELETEPTILPTQESPDTKPELSPEASQITDGIEIFCGSYDITDAMSDDSHYSKHVIPPSIDLSITSETPFSGLYLEWDTAPGIYELTWGGGSLTCGTNDFLHEFIALPEPVTEVSFVFLSRDSQTLCNASLFTYGTPPGNVQVWLPPCEEADILLFPTHSDDDVLFFGPLISYYAMEQNLAVQTAFMVDHGWEFERGHERLNGLWEMGVRHYPILGSAPDTGDKNFDFGMIYYANSNILQWQIQQIRRFRPLVVVGHDFEGEYGNAGHKVNAYYLAQAIEDASDPSVCPESAEIWGLWDTPKFYVHLYPENEWYFDVNTPLSSDPAGRTPFEIAQDAFRHHVSQHTGSLRMHQEDDQREWDCRPFGLYRSLVGSDTGADVMENIDPQKWR